jgi:hypothetical protein
VLDLSTPNVAGDADRHRRPCMRIHRARASRRRIGCPVELVVESDIGVLVPGVVQANLVVGTDRS